MIPPVKPGGKNFLEFVSKNDTRLMRGLKFLVHKNPRARLVDIPCGNCIACRLEKSRQWAVRCVKEASMHKENCFITLTYDEQHIPQNESLRKKDLQDFFKRLRERIKPIKIKYLAVGEYGESTSRPHYHAIVFGYNFKDLKRVHVVNQQTGIHSERRHSPLLFSTWKNGLVSCDEVNFNSCAYVARYNLKKVNGKKARDYYGDKVPEFLHCSKGLSAEWYRKYGYSDTLSDDRMLINGKLCKVPRFFDKLHEKFNPDSFFETRKKRQEFFENLDPAVLNADARRQYKVLMSRQKNNRNRL